MLIYCPNCKRISENTRLFNIANAPMSIKNVTIQCPYCLYPKAHFLDGTHYFDEKGISTLISGPDFSFEILERVKALAETAKEKKYTAEEFIAAAEKISPQAGLLAKYAPKNFSDLVNFITMLIAAVTLMLQFRQPTQQPSAQNTINNNQYINSTPALEQVKKPTGTNKTPKKAKRKKRK